jgi:hypothetical protein
MIPQSTNPELGNVATPLRNLTDCHPKLFWPPHFWPRITSTVTVGGHGGHLTTAVHSHLHPYPMRAGAHTQQGPGTGPLGARYELTPEYHCHPQPGQLRAQHVWTLTIGQPVETPSTPSRPKPCTAPTPSTTLPSGPLELSKT